MKNFIKYLKNPEISLFIKFSIVGVIGAGVNYFFLFIFYGLFNLYYLLAAAISVEIAVISNFILNDKWTFQSRKKKGMSFLRFLKFNLVSSGGIVINLLVLWGLKENFNFNVYFAQFFAILTAWLWNFFINNFWTWRKRTLFEKRFQK